MRLLSRPNNGAQIIRSARNFRANDSILQSTKGTRRMALETPPAALHSAG